MIATLKTASHTSWLGDTHIYQLDLPVNGFLYVAVSVHQVEFGQWQNGGVEIIGCDEVGHAPSLDCLWQSYLVMTHAEALGEIGYEVEVLA